MIDLGIVRPGSLVRIPFTSFDKDDGSAITMTNFAVADILVYKNGGTTERSSTSGFVATTDFDSKTGKHLAVIDLSDNADAGFFGAGNEYLVAIDSVTVDGVTTGGWVARFKIGYPGAMFENTIATLASQTSFTLTVGPAEDDAFNDHWAIVHDVAAGVQCARVLITDYVGSTKTVTLAAGATFTVAVSDNISIMGPAPMQALTLGRKLDVSAAGLAGLDLTNVGTLTGPVFWLGITESGTAQAVGATSIQLRTAASMPDSTAVGATVMLTNGANAGATGVITAYVGSTDTATIVGWSNGATPTGTPTYVVFGTAPGSGGLDAAAIRTALGLATNNLDSQLTGITGRLPASLVSGRMDVSVGAMQASVLTATAIATDALTAAKVASDAVTKIQTGLASGTNLSIAQGDITTLLARLSATRAGYLDNLSGGAVALASALSTVGGIAVKLDTALELDGSVYRFTTNALEQSPAGGGGGSGDWTSDEKIAIRAILGIPSVGQTPADPSVGILDTIRDLAVQVTPIKAKTDQLTFTQAGLLDSNPQRFKNGILYGTGTTGDPWRGTP